MRYFILLVSLWLTSTTAFANSLDSGLLAYERGDYKTAYSQLKPHASSGNTLAQYCMGYMNYMGVGTSQDHQKAANWYERASEQGFTDATYNLGYLYLTGEGVERDISKAIALLTQAEQAGSPLAAYELAVLYEYGDGVTKDQTVATQYYEKARDGGLRAADAGYDRVSKATSATVAEPVEAPQPPQVSVVPPPAPVAARPAPRPATVGLSKLRRLKVDRVNLREGPSGDYQVVAQLSKDTEVRLISARNDWSQVALSNDSSVRGWLASRFLERIYSVSTPSDITQPNVTVTVNVARANMRQGPSAEAVVVAKLSHGQPLQVRRRDDAWVEVEIPVDTGFKGWIHQDLLQWPNQ